MADLDSDFKRIVNPRVLFAQAIWYLGLIHSVHAMFGKTESTKRFSVRTIAFTIGYLAFGLAWLLALALAVYQPLRDSLLAYSISEGMGMAIAAIMTTLFVCGHVAFTFAVGLNVAIKSKRQFESGDY